MAKHGINRIDLLVVNLYPFEKMCTENGIWRQLIEYIDVGGPAMIRAAAKNYQDVAVVVDPRIIRDITAFIQVDYPRRAPLLAKKAFARTAAYDASISNYLYRLDADFPSTFTVQYTHGRDIRYGENPHQKAAVYGKSGIAGIEPIQGKQMSYNNYLDVNAGVGLLREFDEPAAVIVKHNNPCGVAIGTEIFPAYETAREVDPVSAYGSVVSFNREVDVKLAEEICKTFVEVIVAPSFSKEALAVMKKKDTMRVLVLPRKKRPMRSGPLTGVFWYSIPRHTRNTGKLSPTGTPHLLR